MKLLVIDRGLVVSSPEGHQALPFRMYKDQLQSQAGISVEQVTCMELEEIEHAVRSRRADIVLIMMSWRVNAQEASGLLRRIQEIPDRPRIVLLDYFAPSGSPFLPLLPDVDAYVKRQLLKDRALYLEDFRGGLVFTDFLANELGYDLRGWHFGSKASATEMHKLVVGWNLGITPRYRAVLKVTRRLSSAWRLRPIDIHRRFTPAYRHAEPEWYEQYRTFGHETLDKLRFRYRMTGSDRIRPRLYLLELLASKLVVSPFGWGEVCFRDYEAVVMGALLVKPAMDHIETHPDIYKPHETYVPVRWDLKDLNEICEYYLGHPRQSQRIIKNAQKALHDYYEKGGFVADVRNFVKVATNGSSNSQRKPASAELALKTDVAS